MKYQIYTVLSSEKYIEIAYTEVMKKFLTNLGISYYYEVISQPMFRLIETTLAVYSGSLIECKNDIMESHILFENDELATFFFLKYS